MNYRPWGLLEWALQLSSPKQWLFVGALGTEKRSLAVWHQLRRLETMVDYRLLEIHDCPSHHTPLFNLKLEERRIEFVAAAGDLGRLAVGLHLLDEFSRIDERARAITETGNSVVLDITSLPKRYFFPILRRLTKSPRIKDLIVTYTSPERYLDNEAMSERAGGWNHLPGFLPSEEPRELLIVGVGFMVESMQTHIRSITKHDAIKLLIPFPAPLTAARRTWESVYRLQGDSPARKFENYRVGAQDLPAAFERILSLVPSTSANPAFAPFGPKPISAAMCLYAMQHDSGVYYPQPEVYHPNYSQGIGKIGGQDAVHAYWIKHAGEFLYSADS